MSKNKNYYPNVVARCDRLGMKIIFYRNGYYNVVNKNNPNHVYLQGCNSICEVVKYIDTIENKPK